jgi:RluA family pseudouridine synthase
MYEQFEVPVIWNDEYILVINKPPGLLVIPDGYDPLAPHVKTLLSPQYGPLWVVHRLDRYTSGVMVLARNADAHRNINIQFQERQVKKTYVVLVKGNPSWDSKFVDHPLRVNAGRKHRTVVDVEKGKPSVTHLKILERFGSYTLIEAAPETGRRHQIRVHLAAEGFPVACDSLYGNEVAIHPADICRDLAKASFPGEPLLKRPSLHARWIELIHPQTNQRVLFKAPYPDDLRQIIGELRHYSR